MQSAWKQKPRKHGWLPRRVTTLWMPGGNANSSVQAADVAPGQEGPSQRGSKRHLQQTPIAPLGMWYDQRHVLAACSRRPSSLQRQQSGASSCTTPGPNSCGSRICMAAPSQHTEPKTPASVGRTPQASAAGSAPRSRRSLTPACSSWVRRTACRYRRLRRRAHNRFANAREVG